MEEQRRERRRRRKEKEERSYCSPNNKLKNMTNEDSDELFYKYFRLGTIIQKVDFV